MLMVDEEGVFLIIILLYLSITHIGYTVEGNETYHLSMCFQTSFNIIYNIYL